MLPALNEDGARELKRLVLVELAALEEDAEVLEDRAELARLDGNALERVDGLGRAEDAPRRVGGDLGRLGEGAAREELGELARVEVVRAGEVGAAGEADGEVGVVEGAEDVGDDGVVVDGDGEDLALAVDSDDTARRLVRARHEHGLAGDAVHVDARSRLEVVEVDEAVLGDEVDDAVALRDLHRDGEVVGGLGREEDVDGLLGVDGVRRLVVDLDDVELSVEEFALKSQRLPEVPRSQSRAGETNLGAGSGPDCKGEELRIGRTTVQPQLGKARGVALDGLGNSPLARVELHRALDLEAGGVGGVGADADKDIPLVVGGDAVVDNLVPGEGRVTLEDLDGRVLGDGVGGRGGSVGDPVVDGGVGDDAEGGVGDPGPEDDVAVHEVRLDLLLELNVEDLELALGCSTRAKSGQLLSPPLSLSVRLNPRKCIPLRAMTFSSGCMMADSAEIGRRMTLLASLRSMMTTCFTPLTSSRTQMNLSDSSVRVAKPIEVGCTPSAVSCANPNRVSSTPSVPRTLRARENPSQGELDHLAQT